jgi:xanthine dehydrogenase molybdopterin-binding subunit B
MVFPFVLFANYGVIVSIYKSDGTVSVAHGGVEMGQGINTKVTNVAQLVQNVQRKFLGGSSLRLQARSSSGKNFC